MDLAKLLERIDSIEGRTTLTESKKSAEKDDKKEAKKEKMKESSMYDLIRSLDAIVENEKVDEEKVDEDDVEEGNEFSGELAKAKATGKKEFEVDGKTYPVKEASDRAPAKEKETTWKDKSGKEHPAKQVQGWQSRRADKEADDETAKTMKETHDRAPAKEKETTWKDKSGKEHPAKQVQGWQSRRADKEADDETAKTMKESAQLEECGIMAGDSGMSDSGMSVNTNIDTRTGRKSVSVTADGDAADELMQMLKLAGVGGESHEAPAGDGQGDVEVKLVPLAQADGGFEMGSDDKEVKEYANDPNPQTQGVDTQLRQGTDLNKEKQMVKHSYRQGDNPMAMGEAAELAKLEAELFEELDSIKIKESKKPDFLDIDKDGNKKESMKKAAADKKKKSK